MSGWSLIYDGYVPRQQGLREALCALGNGYFVTRGAAPDANADDVYHPGTDLAGGCNRLTTQASARDNGPDRDRAREDPLAEAKD